MKIIIDYKIEKPDVDLLYVTPKINIEEFKETDVELVLLDKTSKKIKEICKDLED